MLTRKKGEEIIINGNIRVVVSEFIGNKVRIGIDAPKNCTVHRREVHEALLAAAATEADKAKKAKT